LNITKFLYSYLINNKKYSLDMNSIESKYSLKGTIIASIIIFVIAATLIILALYGIFNPEDALPANAQFCTRKTSLYNYCITDTRGCCAQEIYNATRDPNNTTYRLVSIPEYNAPNFNITPLGIICYPFLVNVQEFVLTLHFATPQETIDSCAEYLLEQHNTYPLSLFVAIIYESRAVRIQLLSIPEGYSVDFYTNAKVYPSPDDPSIVNQRFQFVASDSVLASSNYTFVSSQKPCTLESHPSSPNNPPPEESELISAMGCDVIVDITLENGPNKVCATPNMTCDPLNSGNGLPGFRITQNVLDIAGANLYSGPDVPDNSPTNTAVWLQQNTPNSVVNEIIEFMYEYYGSYRTIIGNQFLIKQPNNDYVIFLQFYNVLNGNKAVNFNFAYDPITDITEYTKVIQIAQNMENSNFFQSNCPWPAPDS
jgi:hypothetical protein